MPDTADRAAIMVSLARDVSFSAECETALQEVSAQCEGYSGADLQALLYTAQLSAVRGAMGDEDVAIGTPSLGRVGALAALSLGDQVRICNACDPDRPWLHAPAIWQAIDGSGADLAGSMEHSAREEPPRVYRQHLDAALRSTRPSISEGDRRARDEAFRVFGSAGEDTQSRASLRGNRVTHM